MKQLISIANSTLSSCGVFRLKWVFHLGESIFKGWKNILQHLIAHGCVRIHGCQCRLGIILRLLNDFKWNLTLNFPIYLDFKIWFILSWTNLSLNTIRDEMVFPCFDKMSEMYQNKFKHSKWMQVNWKQHIFFQLDCRLYKSIM